MYITNSHDFTYTYPKAFKETQSQLQVATPWHCWALTFSYSPKSLLVNRNFSLINSKKNNVSIDNTIVIYDKINKISRNLILPVSEIHEVLAI